MISALVFGLIMLGVSVWQVRAEEQNENDLMVASESAVVSDNPIEMEVNYYMPYPGILPDHPVYWIKMMRDKIVEVLTLDLNKRVELWVLYADKRMGAAAVLVDGNKRELGVETAEKSVAYLNRAVTGLEELKEKGVDVGDLANRMERGTLRHAQVLKRLELNDLSNKVLELRERILVVLDRE